MEPGGGSLAGPRRFLLHREASALTLRRQAPRAPRRFFSYAACLPSPRRRITFAAFTSACAVWPQRTHRNVARSDRFAGSTCLHTEQIWLLW